MKQNENLKPRVCPYCNMQFTDRPALSRKDNETLICPDCGTREALQTLGIGVAEQDKIIDAIHSSYTRNIEETPLLTAEWAIGDKCYMCPSRKVLSAYEYTIESFDGRYYGIRRNSYFHRVSPSRIFRTPEAAIASRKNDTQTL